MTASSRLPPAVHAQQRAAIALEISALSGPARDPLIREVSLTLPAGETHIIFGPIHSGKSMLMRLILGLEPATAGRVVVDDLAFDPVQPLEAELREIRRRIGVVFEGSALLSRLTVVENVELPLLEHHELPWPDARASARKLLLDVDVNVHEDALPGQLGRAEQRRVALARALALRPALLMLDEPSHGLDPHAAGEIDALIARLQRRDGFAVLIASHEGRYAFSRASRIHVMVDGEVVASGDEDAVRSGGHPVVRQLLERRGGR